MYIIIRNNNQQNLLCVYKFLVLLITDSWLHSLSTSSSENSAETFFLYIIKLTGGVFYRIKMPREERATYFVLV